MKKLVVFFIIYSSGYSLASRNPKNETYNLHYLFKKFTIQGRTVQVQGSYSKLGSNSSVNSLGEKFNVPLSHFNRAKRLGKSVLKAGRKESHFSDMEYDGTGFAIGGNYILTNFHVYSPSFNQAESCSGFTVNLGFGDKTQFKCDKKIKCNKKLDYCLIKVIHSRRKFRSTKLSDLISPTIIHPAEVIGTDNESKILSIGNGGGHGIQASVGKSYTGGKRQTGSRIGTVIYHHATVVKGNSGGPIFDQKDRVIGINSTQQMRSNRRGKKDGYAISNNTYNTAISIYAILKDLKNSSSIKKNVLPFLNIR